MNDQQQSRADALTKLVESYGHALIKQRNEEASAILEMIHRFAASSVEQPAAAPIPADDLEQMTPNQKRALSKGLAALEAMADLWAVEVRLNDMAERIASVADEAERAKRIAAMIHLGFIEGAYRHFIDNMDSKVRAAAPIENAELASMTRMFHAACADLGLINEALGLDPDDGGAEPILDAINELKVRAAQPPIVSAPADERAAQNKGYFVYDPEDNGFELYATDAERAEAHNTAIKECRQEAIDDGEWSLEVESIVSGIVTHLTVAIQMDGDSCDYEARATASTADKMAALIAERDAAMMSTHRQALCIQQCAAHIGRETAATIDGLPLAVKRLVEERDAARAAASPAAEGVAIPDEAAFQRLFSKHGGPVGGEGWCINESGLRDFMRELAASTQQTSGKSGALPPLTNAMRAILTNERCVYGSADELYASLIEAAGNQQPSGEVMDNKTMRLIKTLSDIINDQTVAMQSAIIEWQHGKGAEAGLSWIVNTLEGPGHFPDFDAPHGKHPQFWFNANQANPLPACFCGNPSSSLWMGQGFCCDEHYREAKAKHDAARTQGDSHE